MKVNNYRNIEFLAKTHIYIYTLESSLLGKLNRYKILILLLDL